jgi:hypothetical protein
MTTNRLVFRIGPAGVGVGGHSYEIVNPFSDWLLVGATATCRTCGQTLHLVFDSPPRTGTATCGCGPLGNRKFKILP